MAKRSTVTTSLWGALVVLLALPPVAGAQEVQLSGFAGWRFGGSGRDPISDQEMDIGGSASFGGTAAFEFSERNSIELYFSRAESEAELLFTSEPFDLQVSHLQLGYLRSLGDDGLVPFLGASLGGSQLSRTEGESQTRFSLGAVAGVRYLFSPHFGLRADGRMLFVFDESGSAAGQAPSAGGVIVSANMIVQGELTAGIVLAF